MWSNLKINTTLAAQAAAQQAQIHSQLQNQTIGIQMQADAQKGGLERHKILHDTQTKIVNMQRDVQAGRAKTAERANQILQHIR